MASVGWFLLRGMCREEKRGMRSLKPKHTYYRFDGLLIVPFMLGYALFYIIPLIASPYWAVTKSAFDVRFVGTENFLTVLRNEFYRLAYGNTVRMVAICVPVMMILTVILGFVSWRSGVSRVWLGVFLLPYLLPSASVCAVFRQLFANGTLFTYRPFSSEQFEIERISLYAFAVWKYTGVSLLIFCGALFSFPKEIIHAAAVDGAGEVRIAVQVILPSLKPQLFFILTFACANTLQIFREAYLLYGAYPNDSIYLLQHYMNNHFHKFNYQYVTAGGILFAIPVFILAFIGLKRSGKGILS